jgi:hypothetical protein
MFANGLGASGIPMYVTLVVFQGPICSCVVVALLCSQDSKHFSKQAVIHVNNGESHLKATAAHTYVAARLVSETLSSKQCHQKRMQHYQSSLLQEFRRPTQASLLKLKDFRLITTALTRFLD